MEGEYYLSLGSVPSPLKLSLSLKKPLMDRNAMAIFYPESRHRYIYQFLKNLSIRSALVDKDREYRNLLDDNKGAR